MANRDVSTATRELLEQAALALEACTGPADCCGTGDNGRREWPLKLELLSRIQEHLRTPSSAVQARTVPICEAHRAGELEWPDTTGDMCACCRIAYLEAQESMLEEAQQRAKRAEEAAAEVQRPLDAQMARLNETVTRLNEENARLKSQQSSIAESTAVELLRRVTKAADTLTQSDDAITDAAWKESMAAIRAAADFLRSPQSAIQRTEEKS